MNLVIDIGNTAAKLAAFDEGRLVEVVYDANDTLERLPALCRRHTFGRAVMATVIPLVEAARRRLDALDMPLLVLDATVPTPVDNLYESPETLGADRIAAVVGAVQRASGRDLLVIDAGTCITYDFVDAAGRYHGGNISPGLQMRLKALHHYTGKLPLVAAEGRLLPMGKDTETAIRAGVWHGIEYEMAGYIEAMKHKYPQLLVFLTGGNDFSFDTNLKNIIFADRFLVLEGLNRILNYNNGKI